MTDLEQRIAAMIQDWRNAGQHEHAEYFRRQMLALLRPRTAPARAFDEAAA